MKAEPPPTRGVDCNRSGNGGWLRRLVRRQNRHISNMLRMYLAKQENDSCHKKPNTPNRAAKCSNAKQNHAQKSERVKIAEEIHVVVWLWKTMIKICCAINSEKASRHHPERNEKSHPPWTLECLYGFRFHVTLACRLTKKAEPPPTRGVDCNRSGHGGWLRRLVRPLVNHIKSLCFQSIPLSRLSEQNKNYG